MPATSIKPDQLVVLRGGFAVPIKAVEFLLDLERRGLDIRLGEDDTILVSPNRCLSVTDRELIRAYKIDLMELVAYCERLRPA